MNIIKISMLAGALLIAGTAIKAQSVDDIMEKHIAAIGGADNWNNIKTMKMVGGMSQQGIDISLIQTIECGKAMRTDISAAGMSGWMITTTTQGWMYMPMMGSTKVDTMKPEMVAQQQKQMDFKNHQMLNYKTNGSKLEYTGKDTINNAPCYKLKVTDKDGNESTSYFDCNTYYILRTETKVKINDEEQEASIGYSDYKKLDGGVVMPMVISAQGQDITFKSIDINKPIDEHVFVPELDAPAKTDAPAQESKPTPGK